MFNMFRCISKQFQILTSIIILLVNTIFADEVIVDYSETSLPILNNTLRKLRNDVNDAPKISTGIVAPTSTPKHIGDIFLDTVAHKVYVSDGTDSSTNWRVLN